LLSALLMALYICTIKINVAVPLQNKLSFSLRSSFVRFIRVTTLEQYTRVAYTYLCICTYICTYYKIRAADMKLRAALGYWAKTARSFGNFLKKEQRSQSRFYAPQLYRQVLLRARISYGNSVCLSVCLSVTTGYRFRARWDRDCGSSPYNSLESLVSYDVIWCHWVKRFPSNEGIKERYPLRNRYFTTIGSSSVKTVAYRHRHAAYHNKHCRRAFQWYQHRWPWTTLNPKNTVF